MIYSLCWKGLGGLKLLLVWRPLGRNSKDDALIAQLNAAASVERVRLAKTFGLVQVKHTPEPGEARIWEFEAYKFELTWDRRGNFELHAHLIDWLQLFDVPLPLSLKRENQIRKSPLYLRGGRIGCFPLAPYD